MRQQTLASQASFEKYGRKTRRELFLEEMNQVVPWSELEALVEPIIRKPATAAVLLAWDHAADLLCAAVV